MRTLLAALAFAATVMSAFAGGGGAGHGEEPKREVGVPSLDLPPFMAPVTVNGDLKHYMYIVIKLDLTSDFKKPEVLEKVPYLQDAVLRYVHSVSIASVTEPGKVDEAALSAGLKPVVDKILGPDVVAAVGFRNIAKAVH
jgi:flagellar basal body-associated protein FliL